MGETALRTAGAGGPETAACKDFGDDIVEIVNFLFATIANVVELEKRKIDFHPVSYGTVLAETCLIRAIDCCLTYVSNALQLVYRHRPEALKSNEKIEIDYVLEFASMDELTKELADRKVASLSYRSLADLDTHVSDKLGISLFSSEEQRVHTIRLVDIRNLIVHNRGVVNRMFKVRQPGSSEKLGDRVRFTTDAFPELQFLVGWIADLDVRISEKFSLPTQPRVPRPKPPLPFPA